jgi:hypothetical protein
MYPPSWSALDFAPSMLHGCVGPWYPALTGIIHPGSRIEFKCANNPEFALTYHFIDGIATGTLPRALQVLDARGEPVARGKFVVRHLRTSVIRVDHTACAAFFLEFRLREEHRGDPTFLASMLSAADASHASKISL